MRKAQVSAACGGQGMPRQAGRQTSQPVQSPEEAELHAEGAALVGHRGTREGTAWRASTANIVKLHMHDFVKLFISLPPYHIMP